MPKSSGAIGRWSSIGLAVVGLGLLSSEQAAGAAVRGPFAAPIGAGPVGVSCRSGLPAARVRIAAQIAYADVAPGLERGLRGRRHRGSLELKLKTRRGRTLGRISEAEPLELGLDRDQIHNTHVATLGGRAGKRVLRYARGTRRCKGSSRRNRRLVAVMHARQRLSEPRAGAGDARSRAGDESSSPIGSSTRLRAGTTVVNVGSGPLDSTCPPYPCFGTAASFLGWDPTDSARPFDVASVPLAARVGSPEPGMLIGLDNGAWSYWSDFDLNAQGSAATGNVYNFSRWQYIDSLYYYVHQLVSVPPTAWVNAAHRNGVTALGTVTADCDDCAEEMNQLFEQQGPEAADQLYTLAATYGFDGWIVDVENGATLSDELIAAMRRLAGRTLPSGRKVQVVYYEAGATSLGPYNGGFKGLLAAGAWQADYDHQGQSEEPGLTYSFLEQQDPPLTDLRYSTFWATDVYRPYEQPATACDSQTSPAYLFNGRKCNDIGQLFANLGSARATADPPGFFQSLALYAPAWTMFAGLNESTDPRSPRDVFQAVDEQLWLGDGGYRQVEGRCELAQPDQNSVSSLVAPRSVLTEVPFVTRFNTGEGDRFVVEGAETAAGSWNMLGAQDALPMEDCGEGGTLSSTVDYDDAYDGGSALRVSGTSIAGSQRLYLYEAGAPLPEQPAFTLRYRLPAGGASAAPHVVVWVDGAGPIDLEPASSSTEGGWTRTQATLPPSVGPGTLTRIGVGFDASGGQAVDVLIGELGVVDAAAYEPPTQIPPKLQPTEQGTPALVWDDPPSAPATKHYNVWRVVPGGPCLALVGRSTLALYDLSQPLFAIPSGADEFVIQPVSTSGLAAPLSPAPCSPS
jgi:mannosyl-glycoprotein endo-beta-N-acetylglucosaminidase